MSADSLPINRSLVNPMHCSICQSALSSVHAEPTFNVVEGFVKLSAFQCEVSNILSMQCMSSIILPLCMLSVTHSLMNSTLLFDPQKKFLVSLDTGQVASKSPETLHVFECLCESSAKDESVVEDQSVASRIVDVFANTIVKEVRIKACVLTLWLAAEPTPVWIARKSVRMQRNQGLCFCFCHCYTFSAAIAQHEKIHVVHFKLKFNG